MTESSDKKLKAIAETHRFREMDPVDLLRTFAAVIAELKRRGIARSINNPVADYTEWLVAESLGLELAGNSTSGYDAVAEDGTRYQVKGRRIGAETKSIQLSALRNLERRQFDYLIGVVFEPDFTIRHAALMSHEVVLEYAKYNAHTNSHILYLKPSVLEDKRVQDLREKLNDFTQDYGSPPKTDGGRSGADLTATVATRDVWENLDFSGAFVDMPYRDRFTVEEFDRISRGFIPESMDDKWFVFYEDSTLFIHRSWTGLLMYRVQFDQSQDGVHVARAEIRDEYRGHDIHLKALPWVIRALILGQHAAKH